MPAPAHAPDERQLIAAAQADPCRFAALYDLHFERVYAYVARRVGNRAEAEDVTAEVFQQALASLPRFEWRGAPFAAWLYRIAANAIADRWQRTSASTSPRIRWLCTSHTLQTAGAVSRLRTLRESVFQDRDRSSLPGNR